MSELDDYIRSLEEPDNVNPQGVGDGTVEITPDGEGTSIPVVNDNLPVNIDVEPVNEVEPTGITDGTVDVEMLQLVEVISNIAEMPAEKVERILSLLGIDREDYTKPIERILQEKGMVSLTGELPSYLSNKLYPNHFKINSSFQVLLNMIIPNPLGTGEYKYLITDGDKIYLVDTVKLIIGTETSIDVSVKVKGIAFELQGANDTHGFSVKEEAGEHHIRTDKLTVFSMNTDKPSFYAGLLDGKLFNGLVLGGYGSILYNTYVDGIAYLRMGSKIEKSPNVFVDIGTLVQDIDTLGVDIWSITDDVTTLSNSVTELVSIVDGYSLSITNMMAEIDNIVADGVISPNEKYILRRQWREILYEKDNILSLCDVLGITTEKDTMITAFYALARYLNNGDEYISGFPYMFNDTNMGISTSVSRLEFEGYYDTYFNAALNCLKKIQDKQYEYTYNVNAYANQINNYIGQVHDELSQTNIIVDEISSDSIITKAEKADLINVMREIDQWYDIDIHMASLYYVDSTNYTTAYNNLMYYLNTNIISSQDERIHIVRSTFDGYFDAYFNERKLLIEAINTFVQTTISDVNNLANDAMNSATAAQLDASRALDLLNEISSDGVISPTEKLQLKKEKALLDQEHIEVMVEVTLLGIDTTALVTAKGNLDSMINPLLVDLTVSSTCNHDGLINVLVIYTDERQKVWNQIATIMSDGIGSLNNRTTTIEGELDSITNDSILSSTEKKQSVLPEWNIIYIEKDVLNEVAGAVSPAINYLSDYLNAFQALADYLNNGVPWTYGPTLPDWINGPNLNQDTTIDRETFIDKFRDYYTAKNALIRVINNTLEDNTTRIEQQLFSMLYRDTFNGGLHQFEVNYLKFGGTGSAILQVVNDGTGGNALVLTDGYNFVGKRNIPYDSGKLYRLVVRAKMTAGTGEFYAGVAGIAADGVTLVNVNGVSEYGSQHYICCSSRALTSSYVVYIGYFKGWATPGIGSERPDPTSPAPLHSDVRYIRPIIYANYNNVTGTTFIDYIEISEATADLANQSASIANALIADISNDNKLTPSEKHDIRKEWDKIVLEKNVNNSLATTYGITTENDAYNTEFQNLANYLNGGTAWVSGIPLWINDTNLSTTTGIVGSTFRTRFSEYYYRQSLLLEAISEKSKLLADAAQADADSALVTLANIANDNVLVPSEKHTLKQNWDVILSEKVLMNTQADAFSITTEKDSYNAKFQALANYLNGGTAWSSGDPLWINSTNLNSNTNIDGPTFRLKFKDYYDARTSLLNAIELKAKGLADTAQDTANSAMERLNDISNDDRLTPGEKKAVLKEKLVIAAEYAGILSEGNRYEECSTFKTAYTNAYNSLIAYLDPLLTDYGNTSTIDGVTFRAKFSDYYTARQNLLNKVLEMDGRLGKNSGNLLNWDGILYDGYPIDTSSYSNFAQSTYGGADANAVLALLNPFGITSKVWQGKGVLGNTACGGFYSVNVRVDPLKTYMFAVWMKKSYNAVVSGNIYLGTTPNKVKKITDSLLDSNPYFLYIPTKHLVKDKWYLFVGFINPYNYAGTVVSEKTGVYDPDTNRRVNFDGVGVRNEYKFADSTITSIYLRAIQVSTGDNNTSEYYGAGIWEVNGYEPDIQSLLSGAASGIVAMKPDDANLMAHYSMDKNAMQDVTGNGRTLTATPTAVSVVQSYIAGKAASFDGTKYLYRNDASLKTAEVTVSLWFTTSGLATGQTANGLFSLTYWFCLRLYSANLMRLSGYNETTWFNIDRQLKFSTWYHVVAQLKTGTGGYIKLFIDGQLVGVEYASFAYYATSNMFSIGYDANSSTSKFNGLIDDVRLYNRILADNEVLWLYQNPGAGLDYGALKTIIDGGMVFSGTLMAGEGDEDSYTVKAGMTGQGEYDDSVRFWAGKTFIDRTSAPFRIQQNGKLFATDAEIEGVINALSGYIGGWDIFEEYLRRVDGLSELTLDPQSKRISFSYDGVEKVALFNDLLPLLSTLLSPLSGQFNTGIYKAFAAGDYVPYDSTYYKAEGSILTLNNFEIPNSNVKVVTKIYIPANVDRIFLNLWLTDINGNKIKYINEGYYSRNSSAQTVIWTMPQLFINGGTYKLLLEYTIYTFNYLWDVVIGYGSESENYLYYTEQKQATLVGRDGIISYWNTAKYLYLSASASVFAQLEGSFDISNNGHGLNATSTSRMVTKGKTPWTEGISQTFANDAELPANIFNIIVIFATYNYVVILPKYTSIQSALGLSGMYFNIVLNIAIHRNSSATGYIYGYSTERTATNSTYFPQLLDNNANNIHKLTVEKGDTVQVMLVYDSSGYYAYVLNHRT